MKFFDDFILDKKQKSIISYYIAVHITPLINIQFAYHKKQFLRLIILCFYFIINSVYSQKYGAAWIVGYSNDSSYVPKYGKSELNFSSGNLKIKYTYGEKVPDIGFTNASIADNTGNLKYFTDGYRIYNGLQKIIPNGDSLNFGRIWQDYNIGGYPTEYNHLFLNMPGNENNEFILLHFTLEYHPQFWLRYVYVPAFKITKLFFDNVSKKDIVQFKDSIVSTGDFIQKHMACTRHANGRDWWIIIEDYLSNNHRMYLLDPNGIKLHHTQEIGSYADSLDWTGNCLFSPDGKKYIKYLKGYQTEIFDFDRCNGVLSNLRTMINETAQTSDLCYLAISPNSRFLYLNTDSLIWQYDLLEPNIKNSEIQIGTWDGFVFQNMLNTAFNQMSLAEDGKIYISCRSSSIYLHVINYPDEKGLDCNFQLRGIEIPAFMFGNLPQLPNYKLGPIDRSDCDTLGIDNLPIAEFGYRQDTNQFLQISFRDLSYHNPEKWHWDFDDPVSPNPTSLDTSPIHFFSNSGVYKVCLTVKNINGENTTCKLLQLGVVSINENKISKSIVRIYPNPVFDKLFLNIEDYLPQDAHFIITNEFGNEIGSSKVYNGTNIINFRNLPDGIYFYSCIDKNIELGKGKLVKFFH